MAGKRARWLRALDTLVEDQESVPSIYMLAQTI